MHKKTINAYQLAEIVGLSPYSIHSTLVRRPERLPPPIKVPGSNKLLWYVHEVYDWLERFRVTPTQEPRRRGRPRKMASSGNNR